MPTTQDFEYLLDCKNVIGVDYDERENRVTAFVSRKVPPDELDESDDVEKRVRDVDADAELVVDVVDAGYDEDRQSFESQSVLEPAPLAAGDRGERHRPVPGGVSEINENSTAATGGPYPARVVDSGTADAVWDDDVETGTFVRLSNNHVYARSNEADLGETIRQPSPDDGGSSEDDVGDLVGYVPIEDGVRVDVAARSVDPDQESATYYELEEQWPTGVRRERYEELRGERVCKTGRTTGVTSATVEATSASVQVRFGGDLGMVRLRDQLITGDMSEGGDSGSPVFHEDGELVGLLFAGSPQQAICNRIENVEADLGVEILTEEPTGGDDDEVPVYTTTFETTLSIDFAESTLSFSSITFHDRPEPGQQVGATVVVRATDPGTYWVATDGERERFEIVDSDGDERAVDVDVSIPDDTSETAEITIRGGTVE